MLNKEFFQNVDKIISFNFEHDSNAQELILC